MGLRHSPADSPISFVLLAFGMLLLLAGCSSDRYFMVPKQDLSELNTSVKSQRATLVTMEDNATVRHDQVLKQSEQATQTIIDTIKSQVEKPSCPPVPKQRTCAAASASAGHADRLKGKVVVGEVEKIYLAEPDQIYTARIDSGAETSSIDARNITRFERDGNNWVRFDVPVTGTKELVTIEKEISRKVKVIQASADEAERRIVVELQFAIGDHQQVAEFTLTDRTNLTYQVLIGRNILRDVMLIDVGKEFATTLPKAITNKRSGS
jgi:hypothetical protein